MVKLTSICKSYVMGDTSVKALTDVSIQFRQGEFVSILGPSGCGKTTLLNIIGGLDSYDSGDISVNGKSTKAFKASDWDNYRNHSIGFVFQSYNLIGHQTILSNVELALTLAGVSKTERKRRAKEALEKVGLGNELKKKPNQLSGGQMQRVAIARALINDPEIILADEPTGALDSDTSLQVMELLREVAKDRLVIMVTHNAELAEQYSTRIIRLKDGRVFDDSNPCNLAEYSTAKENAPKHKKKEKKSSMSLKTAFSLSLNNLLTKKGRTLLTSFAGSIGIIGIALILSMSSGFQGYIDRVQEETLSTYPLSIQSATVDGGMVSMMMGGADGENVQSYDDGKIHSGNQFSQMYNAMEEDIHLNDLKALKEYIESDASKIRDVSTVQYDYDLTLDFYIPNSDQKIIKADTLEILDSIYLAMTGGMASYTEMMDSVSGMMGGALGSLTSSMSMDMWCELIDNQELLTSQYDLVEGNWPEAYNEVVLCVSENNTINEMIEFAMGLRTREELDKVLGTVMSEEGGKVDMESNEYTYEQLLSLTYKLALNSSFYIDNDNDGVYTDVRNDQDTYKDEMLKIIDNGIDIKVVGIIKPAKGSVAQSMSGVLGYTHKLVEEVIKRTAESNVVKAQKGSPDINILTGLPFAAAGSIDAVGGEGDGAVNVPAPTQDNMGGDMTGGDGQMPAFDLNALLSDEQKQQLAEMISAGTSPEEAYMTVFADMLKGYMSGTTVDTDVASNSYDDNMKLFGSVDLDTPSAIHIYPIDFASKDTVKDEIAKFNEGKNDEEQIKYTDILDLLLSSVSTIIDAISYVLIAFVSISLVVSSIMIGVITYISVLERTKEIGILRAMGASKRDIARVFNAETLIIGLAAGLLGIGVTVLLNIPINKIINSIAQIGNIAKLPTDGAIVLVCISMLLTFIAGLIPSKMASKKDPVVALRTE